jgi:hypothetical protein
MRTLRFLSATLLAFGLATLWAADTAGVESEYAGGTVVSIPLKAKGRLDVSDDQSLRFHFGSQPYKINYSRITSMELNERNDKLFGKVPIPMKKTQVLTIGFSGSEGRGESVILEMSKDSLGNVLPALEEKSHKRITSAWAEAAARANADEDGNTWWGDRYWRTNRNSQGWEKPADHK